MFVLAYAEVFHRHGGWAQWERELQVARHFGDQDHWETNALLILRWTAFPWDWRTSLALGEGVSWASEVPALEDELLAAEGGSTRFLNYLLIELTTGLPFTERWNLVGRIHHRSGVFGLYDDVEEGSNFLTLGLRFEF